MYDSIFNNKAITIVKTLVIMSFFLISAIDICGATLNRKIVAEAGQQPGIAIAGIVSDTDGAPLPGVQIVIKGTTRGVLSDNEGHFSITVPDRDAVLVFSFMGFTTFEQIVGTMTHMNITLEETAAELEEVVVVGYGVQRKQTVTGAINSISSEVIMRSPTASVSNSLAGRLPGLTVVQRSGEPGRDGAIFKIRGIGTLNDGQESAPLIMIDGIERTTLDMLDPNEISTVNILKDASATAVYGVRGANGVILITTQSGSAERLRVSLSANFGFQNFTMMPQLVNAYEWATLYNEGLINENSTRTPYSDDIMQKWKDHSSPVIFPDVDWVDLMFRKYAPQQHYNVNVSGGNNTVKYFVSFGMLHQEGIYKDYAFEGMPFSVNPDYKRYNLRSNFDINVTKRLKLSLRLASIFTDGNYANTSTTNIFDYLTRTAPGGSIGVLDGKLITGYSGNDPLIAAGRQGSSNIINSILNDGFREYNASVYNLNANLAYDLGFLVKGLEVNAKIGYDDFGDHQISYNPVSIPSYTVVIENPNDPNGYTLVRNGEESYFSASESYSNSRYRNIYLEGSLSYSAMFGNHHVSALALYNQKTSNSPTYQYDLPRGLLGFVGRVTYNYDYRYMAEFNMGYNGSENFIESKRFGFFPAFSLGWLVTQEKFIPKNKYLTYLKIRGSYGEVGNDQIGGSRYLYLPSTFSYGVDGYNWGTYGENIQYYRGSREGVIGNPNVTWERAKKSNIGAEIKMFGDRFSLTADLFREKRDNILWHYGTVPSIVGASFSAANLGKVNNKGFEIEGTWTSHLRDFNYWLGGTFSFAKNKIIYMDEATRPYPYLSETGYSVGQYKGYVNEGFINTVADLENQPAHGWGANWDRGELNFIDINGDGIIDANDKVTIGYGPYPEINYGFNVGFSFRNFDFSALFQGVANVTLYLRQSAVCPLYYGRSAQKWHLGRWTEERYLAGEKITYPRMLADNVTSPSFLDQNPISTFWLYDASYLRLRNLEVAYSIKTKGLKKAGVSFIRVYANGNNLLTFTNMENFDPEAPSGIGSFYPMQKVYNLGLKIEY